MLYLELQGKEKFIVTLFGILKIFQNKFLNQIGQCDFSHIECGSSLKKEDCGVFPN